MNSARPRFPMFSHAPRPLRLLSAAMALLALLLLALVALVMFFPWDSLRGPVSRMVSERTGRAFEISERLDVRPGWRQATVVLDGLSFANPAWARDGYLVRARRAEFDIRLWPLLAGRVELPRVQLHEPRLGLQMEADGRRTWSLGQSADGPGTGKWALQVGQLLVDRGDLAFLAPGHGVDLKARFDLDPARGELPLDYAIQGRYKGQPLQAKGRSGPVLHIADTGAPPFPLEIDARAGATRLQAKGNVASLAKLDGIAAQVKLSGRTLGDLFPLLGVSMPETPPYAVQADLRKNGTQWDASDLKGKLGLSDIGGQLSFEQGGERPRLSGKLASRVLDMDDLGPLIGLQPTARSAAAVKLEGVGAPQTAGQAERRRKDGKVLPTATLAFDRLQAMDADVHYKAERIRNVHQLPLEFGELQVRLKDAVLQLDPLDLGVAGGHVRGAIRIDGSTKPADIRAALDLKGLQLARLLPKLESAGTSVGRLDGRFNVAGPGVSVATWLGGASGDVALLMGRGQFGNLLPVMATLVGGDIIKFIARGDRDVELRCAALAFDVNKGLMNGRTLMLDTSNAIFQAKGQIDLGTERLDLVIYPEPKSASILSVRTPLTVTGTLADPRPGVEIGPLAARLAAVVAGAAINPLLGLAATLETGPGKDADCAAVLGRAAAPTTPSARQGAARAKSIR